MVADEHVSWHSVLERGHHGGGVPEVGLVDPDVVLCGGPDGGGGTLRARPETLAPSLAANVARKHGIETLLIIDTSLAREQVH